MGCQLQRGVPLHRVALHQRVADSIDAVHHRVTGDQLVDTRLELREVRSLAEDLLHCHRRVDLSQALTDPVLDPTGEAEIGLRDDAVGQELESSVTTQEIEQHVFVEITQVPDAKDLAVDATQSFAERNVETF